MKNLICFLAIISSATSSFAQTKVGDIQFNDVDIFNDHELMLNGAGEVEKKYAIALYLDLDVEVDGVEDGVKVAEKNSAMGVTIKLTSAIDNEEFKEIIRNGIERATDGNGYLLENQIRDFLNLLPSEINKHDIFRISHSKGGDVSLYEGKTLLGKVNSLDLKKALFKIWLGENPVDIELKENLLKSYEPDPILGQWKTFDKKSGVAISIVQLYIIEDKVFGSIQRMLRESERDAVCYECEGDDKNKKVEGLIIVKRLRLKGDKYVDGKFTDIKSGKVSDCQMWIEEGNHDILNVRYKGGGGTHIWKKVKK